MFIAVSSQEQIGIIESLAREIWTEHYTPIIGREQVDYMLGRFQSREAIAEQIRSGFLYFLIGEGREYVGYIGVQPRNNELFLSKIYVSSSRRGRGYGKKAIHFIERLARERGLKKITLTVNKNNASAVAAYSKMGFRNLGPVVQKIGGGFIMDDYMMEKTVPPAQA